MKILIPASCIHAYSLLISLLLTCALPAALQAQDPVGAIEGFVTDASGASVVAHVMVQNLDTDRTREASADGSGAFRFAQIPIGRYRITVKAEHFATVTQEPVTVNISQNLHLHFSVELSSRQEHRRRYFRRLRWLTLLPTR